jgi:hypothetical protein
MTLLLDSFEKEIRNRSNAPQKTLLRHLSIIVELLAIIAFVDFSNMIMANVA